MAFVVFSTPVGYRLYDREKNRILALREEEFQALRSLKNGQPLGERGREIYARLNAAGYCEKSSIETILHPQTPIVDAFLSKKVGNLVLQVTQDCNLRCKYCVYSGNYYNRVHSKHKMSEEIALRAVDFFMERSSAVESPIIGFYGGEPFLEFELIKKVVNYVNDAYADRNCGFNLTTNLTLLNDEIIKFVIKNNVNIMISIDGPEQIQNRNRVFESGKGSFDTVVEKAKKFKEANKDFFLKCHTNTVIAPDTEYEQIYDFFDNDALFGPLPSRISTISDSGVKEKAVYNDRFFEIQRRENFKQLLEMMGEIKTKSASQVFAGYRGDLKKTFTQLKTAGMQGVKVSHPGGPCMPGARKLFVDIYGNFYPCEKISEEKCFQIGNLWDGFDKERIKELLNVAKYTEDECKSCWAFAYCTTCAASMIETDKLSRERRMEKCNIVRSLTLSLFQDIETLKYYGYDFEGGTEG